MRRSMAYSRIMDTKGEKMLERDFTPQAKLSQHIKDVQLMLDEGKNLDWFSSNFIVGLAIRSTTCRRFT